jgi:hypothetical protein
MDLTASSLLEVEAWIYDFAPAETPDYVLGDYLDQFHFAPCVHLPVEVEVTEHDLNQAWGV